jgi:ribonuclease HI
VKVNTDAAFDANSCTGSSGVVIRDHAGRVLSGAARWFEDVLDVLTAEALAAKEGLELAVENG